ncbi:MAG: BrnT family toxin [Planctomycetes bacterium]|nr:BrnT family toxin [Planctomycetota bacterium]
MATAGFDWDEHTEGHVARHGVIRDEVEEVFRGRRFTQRSRRGSYATYGRSLAGRYLFVVWRMRKGGRIRVITARDMRDSERRRYRREAR